MSDRAEAEALAAAVRAFWTARGKSPAVRIQQEYATASRTDERLGWVVRSDMLGGWPQVGPSPVSSFNPRPKSESGSGLARFSRVYHAPSVDPAVRAPCRVWRGVRP